MKFKQYVSIILSLAYISILSSCAASDVQSLTTGGEAISQSASKLNPINHNKVRLYYSKLNQPKHYESVGRVSASNDNLVGIPHSDESISETLKQEAASLGANAVINITTNLEKTVGDAVLVK